MSTKTVAGWLAACALVAAAASEVRADEIPPGVPLIAKKRYPMAMRLEVTPLFHYSFNDKYTHHAGFQLVVGFHPFDWLGLELYGGYNINGFGEVNGISGWPAGLRSGWISLTHAVNSYTHSDEALRDKPLELPDLYYQAWLTGADVIFAPFYGKWSIVSEVGGSMYVYGLVGVGAAGTNKEDYRQRGKVVPGPVVVPLHYGAGVRVFLTDWMALRVELRDFWWINPEVEEWKSADDHTDPCPNGYCLTDNKGNKKQYTDFSRMSLLQVGTSFVF